MTVVLYIISGLVGWCPTPPLPKPPGPKDPLAGIIGGLVGAYTVSSGLALAGPLSSMDLVAVMIGAFAFGKVFQQLANWFVPGPERG